jgi:hypothetical protein
VSVFVSLALKLHSIPQYKNPPLYRQLARACIDRPSSKLYLFGGLKESGTLLNDLWALDIAANYWEEQVLVTPDWPPARMAHACVIDETTRVFYIFGGEASDTLLNDLWAFSMTTSTVM